MSEIDADYVELFNLINRSARIADPDVREVVFQERLREYCEVRCLPYEEMHPFFYECLLDFSQMPASADMESVE